MAEAWGLGATLPWFHFFPGVHALVRGWVGEGGVDGMPLSWPSPLPHVYKAPVMLVSALELASLPSESAQGLVLSWWSPPWRQPCSLLCVCTKGLAGNGWSEVGLGLSWLSSLQVCIGSLKTAASALVASSTRARGTGAGAKCRLGSVLRWSWQAGQSPRQFSICCLHTVIRSKQVHACVLQEWGLSFLWPSGKPHWFSN